MTADKLATMAAGARAAPARRTHGLEWPWHPLQVLSWLVFGLDIIVYIFFVVPLLTPLCVQVIALLLFAASAAAVAAFTVKATRCDTADPNLKHREQEDLESALEARGREERGDGRVPGGRFCAICHVTPTRASKHCYECNKCTAHFDHHCLWLNTCVGGDNYRYFFAAVVTTAVLLAILLVTSLQVLAMHALGSGSLAQGSSWLRAMYVVGALPREVFIGTVIGLLTINAPIFFLDGTLGLLHVWLQWRGLTTYEYILQQRDRDDMRKEAFDTEGLGQWSRLPRCLDWIVFGRCGGRRRRRVGGSADGGGHRSPSASLYASRSGRGNRSPTLAEEASEEEEVIEPPAQDTDEVASVAANSAAGTPPAFSSRSPRSLLDTSGPGTPRSSESSPFPSETIFQATAAPAAVLDSNGGGGEASREHTGPRIELDVLDSSPVTMACPVPGGAEASAAERLAAAAAQVAGAGAPRETAAAPAPPAEARRAVSTAVPLMATPAALESQGAAAFDQLLEAIESSEARSRRVAACADRAASHPDQLLEVIESSEARGRREADFVDDHSGRPATPEEVSGATAARPDVALAGDRLAVTEQMAPPLPSQGEEVGDERSLGKQKEEEEEEVTSMEQVVYPALTKIRDEQCLDAVQEEHEEELSMISFSSGVFESLGSSAAQEGSGEAAMPIVSLSSDALRSVGFFSTQEATGEVASAEEPSEVPSAEWWPQSATADAAVAAAAPPVAPAVAPAAAPAAEGPPSMESAPAFAAVVPAAAAPAAAASAAVPPPWALSLGTKDWQQVLLDRLNKATVTLQAERDAKRGETDPRRRVEFEVFNIALEDEVFMRWYLKDGQRLAYSAQVATVRAYVAGTGDEGARVELSAGHDPEFDDCLERPWQARHRANFSRVCPG